MSFTPVVPLGGFGGWSFLNRTLESQKAAFEKAPELKRDEDYFREKIGRITTAEALVSDRRLLKVALGAHGLEDDINNRYFIRKVLEDGTLDPKALANRLSNKQYQKLSTTFGFGDLAIPGTQLSDFADRLLSDYRTRQFEVAVGKQNDGMRLALNAQREVPALAATGSSEETKWFTMMGSAPMRQVFERAFSLPTSFGALDLDKQLETFQAKATKAFGSASFSQFSKPDVLEVLVKQFLLRSDLMAGVSANTPGSTALQLLQTTSSAASNILSLLR